MITEQTTKTLKVTMPSFMGQPSEVPQSELALKLANTITHQFNNLMMSISSNAELELKKMTFEDRRQDRKLEQIVEYASRATLLVKKLQICIESLETHPEETSINDIAHRLKRFFHALLLDSREVELDLSPAAARIYVDADRMEQALVYLMFHSRLGSVDSKIRIRTMAINSDAQHGSALSLADNQPRTVLCVEENLPDNQALVTPNISAEPIKAVRQMLHACNADLVIHQEGRVREYKIVCQVMNSSHIAQDAPKQPATTSSRTILIVDDDTSIRNAAAEFLRIERFKVLQARDAEEAVEIVEKGRFTLDLLITDLVMGGLSGSTLAQKLRSNNPRLQVLFISGDATKSSELSSIANNHVMLKPFRLDKMTEKIRTILHS